MGQAVAPGGGPSFQRLLNPRTVAVVGASATEDRPGNVFIRTLQRYGFTGTILPVHPRAATVEGLPAHPSIATIPGIVDYAYIAVRAADVASVLDAGAGKVAFAQVLSSAAGTALAEDVFEAQLREVRARTGVRIIGPNSLGALSPAGRLTYMDGAPTDAGDVALIAQSGGMSVDIVRRGGRRGVRWRASISVGNAVDVSISELIAFFQADAQTRVIAVYVEGLRDGPEFVRTLRGTARTKPLVVLKGGLTGPGARAARSHTGALAADRRVWQGVAAQCGFVLVDGLEEFVDGLVACDALTARAQPSRRVVLFGNGGGYSVVAADALAGAGLTLAQLQPETIAALERLGPPPGSTVSNPIDVPSAGWSANEGRLLDDVLDVLLRAGDTDAIILYLNLMTLVREGHLAEGAAIARRVGQRLAARVATARAGGVACHFALVLRSDGSPELRAIEEQVAQVARAGGIPVYEEFSGAARGLAVLASHEAIVVRQGAPGAT